MRFEATEDTHVSLELFRSVGSYFRYFSLHPIVIRHMVGLMDMRTRVLYERVSGLLRIRMYHSGCEGSVGSCSLSYWKRSVRRMKSPSSGMACGLLNRVGLSNFRLRSFNEFLRASLSVEY